MKKGGPPKVEPWILVEHLRCFGKNRTDRYYKSTCQSCDLIIDQIVRDTASTPACPSIYPLPDGCAVDQLAKHGRTSPTAGTSSSIGIA